MDEVGIGLLCPTPRHLIELVRKDAHRYRDGDALRVEEAELVFPIETSRRDPRGRQPVVGDVVEDVVSCKALGLSVEDTCDQRQTSRVVVEHPGGKADGGIRNSVQRLWVGPHLECIGSVGLKEVLQLLVEACSLVSKTGRRGAAGLDRRCDIGSNSTREVGVDADQPRWRLYTHQINDLPAPIAALGDVAVVSQALHQLRPGTRDVLRAPAGAGWLAGESVARHRRNHQMESVRCARAMCRRIGQGIDDLQLLDDRAGPSVRDDERQRILMVRTNVNEMDVQPVDLGDEVREGLQLLLALAPVVLFRPIARECLHRREPRALRLIFDGLLFGPARRRYAPPKVVEVLFRHVDAEGADCGMGLHRLYSSCRATGGDQPRLKLFNKGSLLLCEWSVCAPWHKTPQSTKKAPNFGELRVRELPRIPKRRSSQNASSKKFAEPEAIFRITYGRSDS